MNSKKISKKLDNVSEKLFKYLSVGDSLVSHSHTKIDLSFIRNDEPSKFGFGTIGVWRIIVGEENQEFTAKTINSVFRKCLRHYKEIYRQNLCKPSEVVCSLQEGK